MDEATIARHTSDSLARIGHFEIFEKLGSGAFGTVWKAFDTWLERVVAIKTPRAGRLDPAEAEKFLREARATAQLRHPNIISVYEVGREGELVYIVSDFVEGQSLADWLAERRSSVREAAVLGAKLARALHHAHEAGIIHRDLKPHNILIDDRGEPYLMDFGLARREAGEATLTLDGQLLGTPAYMSPEQARGDAHAADRQSDIYSLGAVLFQLLTGELPFRGNTRMILHQVIHDEPPSPRKLNAREQRRESYYSKIAEAKAHVDRGSIQQAMEVLLSCPEEHRHWEWGHLVQQCHQDIVSIQAGTTNVAHLEFSPDGKRILTLSVDGQLRVWDWKADEPEAVFALGDESNRVALAGHAPDGGHLAVALNQGVTRLFSTKDWREVRAFGQEGERPTAMDWHPNGRQLAIGTARGVINVWDSISGDCVHRLEGHHRVVASLAYSPGAQRLVSRDETRVRVWDASTGKPLTEFGAELPEGSVVFGDAAGSTFAAVDPDNMVRVWCPTGSVSRSGMPVRMQFNSAPAESSSQTSSGTLSRFTVTLDKGDKVPEEGGVQDTQLARHQPHLLGKIRGKQPGETRRLFFSPDGRWLGQAGEEGTARVWDLERLEERFLISTRTHRLVFSPDSRRLAALGEGSVTTIWDVEKGQVLKTLKGQSEIIERSAFDPSGDLVATADAGGTIKIWTASPGREVMEEMAWVHGLACSPDGALIAAAPFGGGLVIRDAESGRRRLTIRPHHEWFSSMAFSPDGRRLAAVGSHKAVKVYDVQTGALMHPLAGHARQCLDVAYAPDGARFVTVGMDGTARIWDGEGHGPLGCIEPGLGPLYGVQFIGSGRIAILGDVPSIPIWDLNSLTCVGELVSHPDVPWSLAVSHDGQLIAARYMGAIIRLWDAASGTLIRQWESHGYRGRMSFSPDDRRLVALTTRHGSYGYEIGIIEVWDPATSRQLLILEKHADPSFGLDFSPDGLRLGTSASDFTIRQTDAFSWGGANRPCEIAD